MTTLPHDHDDRPDDAAEDALPDALHASLRALRRDTAPGRELWPDIAARIGADAQARTATAAPAAALAWSGRHRRRRRFAAYAAAASLALAFGVVWQLRPAPSVDAQPRVLVREAERMTLEYQTAWQSLDARRRPDVDATALHQLDRSAAEVRAALHQDPDARFLFDRLQSLYARRLDLAQRFAVAT